MKIVNSFPPNYEEVKKRFNIGIDVCFAYGDTIYNPSAVELLEHIIQHEEVHSKQQQKIGAEEWWKKYLINDVFRLEQEIPAYQKQYKVIKSVYNRAYRRQMLDKLAHDLSGKMYGNLCTFERAKELIQ